LNKYAKLRLY